MADTTSPRTTRRDAQREDVRFRLLRALERGPGSSQRALAQDTGVSLGAVNGLLNAMIETGLVRIGNSEGSLDRFRFAYGLTRKGKAEIARLGGRFLERRRAELAALRREVATLEAELGHSPDRPA